MSCKEEWLDLLSVVCLCLCFGHRMVYVSLTSLNLNVGVDLNERECVRSEVELV